MQPQYRPLSIGEETALLLAVKEGRLDALSLPQVDRFKAGLGDWLVRMCPKAMARVAEKGLLDPEERQALLASLDDFIAGLGKPAGAEA